MLSDFISNRSEFYFTLFEKWSNRFDAMFIRLILNHTNKNENMNNELKATLISSLMVLTLVVSSPAQAISTFARQTGMPCTACHFQNFPALNGFGRVFKSGGYTFSGAQGKVEGQALSISDVLNAGAVMKLRFQKSNGPSIPGTHTTNDGEFQIPDELLLNVGGRIGDNIGALVELDLYEADPLVSGLKIPFTYDMGGYKVAGIPFSTSSQGVAYGFELLNTGAVRFSRVAEDRSTISAQQYIGTATRAQGLAVVISNEKFFGNYSKWSPRTVGDDSGSPTANYFRLATTPRLGAWDIGAGIQYWSGSATEPVLLSRVETKAWAIDAQAQGSVSNMPLGLYLTYANAEGTPVDAADPNLFNGNPNDRKAAAIVGQLGILTGKATLLLGFRHGDNGRAIDSGDNALLLGATYLLRQNIQFQLNHTEFSGSSYNEDPANGDRMTTLMLYTSF